MDTGVMVIEAVEDAPADEACIQRGTRIVRIGHHRIPLDGDISTIAVNGEPASNVGELRLYLETQAAVGDSAEITIIRDSVKWTVHTTLDE